MVADANEPSSSTRPCTRSCTNSRRDTGTSQSKKAAMKHTLCARPAHVCMQACAVSGLAQPSMWHLALEPFQGELAPNAPARPPPREHMHHPHIASFLDTACTTLARSSTACSSQNGSLIHRTAASAKAKALDASRGRARQLTTRAGGSSVASFASQHAQPLPAAASHAAAKTARSSTAAATAKAKALNASAGRARQLICELVAAA